MATDKEDQEGIAAWGAPPGLANTAELTTGEKIKILMKRNGVTVEVMAQALGCQRSNLYKKFAQDRFTEKDLRIIARVLGCTLKVSFVGPDGVEM